MTASRNAIPPFAPRIVLNCPNDLLRLVGPRCHNCGGAWSMNVAAHPLSTLVHYCDDPQAADRAVAA